MPVCEFVSNLLTAAQHICGSSARNPVKSRTSWDATSASKTAVINIFLSKKENWNEITWLRCFHVASNFNYCWMPTLNATFLFAFHPLLAALWRSKVANVEVSLEGTPSDDDIFPSSDVCLTGFSWCDTNVDDCRAWIGFIVVFYFVFCRVWRSRFAPIFLGPFDI